MTFRIGFKGQFIFGPLLHAKMLDAGYPNELLVKGEDVNVDTGSLHSQAEYDKMNAEQKKRMEPIPADTKLDTVHKLQKKDYAADDRQRALKSFNRKKAKEARKARKKNRK